MLMRAQCEKIKKENTQRAKTLKDKNGMRKGKDGKVEKKIKKMYY